MGRHAAPKPPRGRHGRPNQGGERLSSKFDFRDRLSQNRLARKLGATALAAAVGLVGLVNVADRSESHEARAAVSAPTAQALGQAAIEHSQPAPQNLAVEAAPNTPSPTPTAGAETDTAHNDMTYYSQYDPRWSEADYGGRTVQSSGCAPTSLAMVVTEMTGHTVTPAEMAEEFSNYYSPGQGTEWTIYDAVAREFGLHEVTLDDPTADSTEQTIRDTLAEGGMAVLSGGGGSYPFTSNAGHVLVVRGTDDNGNFLLANPLPVSEYRGEPSADYKADDYYWDMPYSFEDLKDAGLHGAFMFTPENAQ